MELKEEENEEKENEENENEEKDDEENGNEQINEINNNNKPEFYLLITGEAGKNNYGVLVRSASAFDCKEIYILGAKKNIVKKFFGNHGTAKKMKYNFFSSPEEIKNHCTKNDIQICGVNINYKKDKKYNALPIEDINFENKKTLFILGNSMYPIKKELESIINIFSYVNQEENEKYKHELNLAIIGSITMHYFGIKNDYKMAGLNELYNDEKYIVKKNENNFNKINEENNNKKKKIDEK